jgi:hypothetical protein
VERLLTLRCARHTSENGAHYVVRFSCATSASQHLLSSYFSFATFRENSRFFFDCRQSGMAPARASPSIGIGGRSNSAVRNWNRAARFECVLCHFQGKPPSLLLTRPRPSIKDAAVASACPLQPQHRSPSRRSSIRICTAVPAQPFLSDQLREVLATNASHLLDEMPHPFFRAQVVGSARLRALHCLFQLLLAFQLDVSRSFYSGSDQDLSTLDHSRELIVVFLCHATAQRFQYIAPVFKLAS